KARALLVLSETLDPGWRAQVNGDKARIYRVDGDLRGIVAPAGTSRVVLHYGPRSFYAGALLTLIAFFGIAYICAKDCAGFEALRKR
ncbi:MAG: YfhO family protein, partial [Acidobacteriia bacterium]|nr:YfhO family protein [Terriglobia bacterium]MBV8903602.1 YfhO family protein [Terriglobia bacterium]